MFDTQNTAEQKFEVFMNAHHDTSYHHQVQYHFDPTSGWEGQHFSYNLPTRSTEDRTLYLNPYEDFGFQEIRVVPNRIDWGVINSTDVFLTYQEWAGGARIRSSH